jgi:flagellar basal-body rod modification protein FlgD
MITLSTNPVPETPAVRRKDSIADPAATKQMFLQLLVTQIKNQNPLNPADPAEFLSQLTQFTSVEQMLEMRQQLEAIRELLESSAARSGADSEADPIS